MVISPQCPEEVWWSIETLHALINEIVETHRIDQSRIYVTGLSMGGYGSWGLGVHLSGPVRRGRTHLRGWGA